MEEILKIDLPDYRKIGGQIKRNKIEVSDQEIEQAVVWLQKSRAKTTLKNGPAEKGDFVQIEFKENNNETRKDGFILGQGYFLPGFEDALAGMKAGEEKKGINLKKEDKNFLVDVKIISVQKIEFSKINDDFARSLGEFKDLTALKESIKQNIIKEKEGAEFQRLSDEFLNNIEKKVDMKLPQYLIENEQKEILEDLKGLVAKNMKMNFEDYLVQSKKTEKELLEVFKPKAEEKIKRFLILREIGKKENIEVSEKEVEEEMSKLAEQFSGKDINGLKNYVREVIKNNKIFKLLNNLIPKL